MSAIRTLTRTSFLIALVVVTGCAQHPAYRSGMQLVADGRIEDGLVQLELATRQVPQNAEYRSALYRQRELAVTQLLAQAEAARASNDSEAAAGLYRRVLGIEAANVRAKAGIDQLATDRRHQVLLAEAAALLKKNDRAGAAQKIHSVLAENANQPEARAMQRRLDEARVQGTLAVSRHHAANIRDDACPLI